MQNYLMRGQLSRLGAALVWSVAALAANAQAMPGMAADPGPGTVPAQPVTATPAQMQQEIDSLRAQVQQLQKAHDMPMEKMDQGKCMGMAKGMAMDKCMGMKGKGVTKPPAASPMKKPGMGMMDDDAMEMPMKPADPAEPAPMPHM